ncbi:MAG: PAS domain-containing protein, partial [Candidatus Thorarchaeota archaeon]
MTSDHNYSDRLDRTAFGRVIGKMPIAVFVVSADYTIIYANRAARDIVRLSEKDLRGKNFMSLVSPEQRDAALEFLHLPA